MIHPIRRHSIKTFVAILFLALPVGCRSQWQAFEPLLDEGLELHQAVEESKAEHDAILDELAQWATSNDISATPGQLFDHAAYSSRFAGAPGSDHGEPSHEFEMLAQRVDAYLNQWSRLSRSWRQFAGDLEDWAGRYEVTPDHREERVAFKQSDDGGPRRVDCELLKIFSDEDGLWICWLVTSCPTAETGVYCVWRCIIIPRTLWEKAESVVSPE